MGLIAEWRWQSSHWTEDRSVKNIQCDKQTKKDLKKMEIVSETWRILSKGRTYTCVEPQMKIKK